MNLRSQATFGSPLRRSLKNANLCSLVADESNEDAPCTLNKQLNLRLASTSQGPCDHHPITTGLEATFEFKEDSSSQAEFQDLIGRNNLDFSTLDPSLTEALIMAVREDLPADRILESIFKKDRDQLVRHACLAFKQGALTRAQIATCLYLREIDLSTSSWQQLPLTSYLSETADQELKNLIHFFLPKKSEQEQLIQGRRQLPQSEQTYFQITINTSDLQDDRILHLLSLAYNLKVVYFDKNQLENLYSHLNPPYQGKSHDLTFSILSTGAMDAVTQIRYGKHAKRLLPRLGKMSIDDIESGIKKKARYATFSHPDVAEDNNFHDIQAPLFYLTLHDELHRQLISSIPDTTYQAYQEAISVIRSATGLKWSRELWNAVDAEIGVLLSLTEEQRNDASEAQSTQSFCALLSAKLYSTKEPLGLFNPETDYLDTTLILMIDLYKNPEKWAAFDINPAYLTEEYRKLYQLVSTHADLVQSGDLATQVARLKAHATSKPLSKGPYTFVKHEKYVQVKAGSEPLKPSKAMKVALAQYKQELTSLQIELKGLQNTPEMQVLRDKASAVANAIQEEFSPVSCLSLFSKRKTHTLQEVTYYTNSLKLTRQLLNPMNRRNVKFQKQYQDLIEQGKPSIQKKVIGAMMVFLGAVTIGFSFLVTAASLGTTSALTIAGVSLGAAAILGGVGVFRSGLRRSSSAAMLDYAEQIKPPALAAA